MIIARIFPKKSENFKSFQPFFQNLGDNMDSGGWIRIFSFWTLIVAGIVLNMDLENRYVYWNWEGWELGFGKLIVASFIYFYFLNPNNLWIIGARRLKNKEIVIHSIIAFVLLYIGSIGSNSLLPNFMGILSYLIAFLSCLLIFQFPLALDKDKGIWNCFDWNNKMQYFLLSLLLMVASVILGVFLDDPIMSTAGTVSVAFPLVGLIWPNHVRHLQRARFFPLFTFSMFLCVRAPWFLIPLCILFFLIRTINYFRFGIVYPSFGVDFLED
tara:strand:- start:520 stop:1329 length:810 start_codon:yes stop_codon:yes gene_type:complete